MKILAVGGSPKSEVSITQQYVRFLEQSEPAHLFVRLYAARRLRAMERDPAEVARVVSEMADADLVLLATPVYYFLVPSQLKRFLELVHEHAAGALNGRYATALTTSIHFFDHTAHDYLWAECEDLGMRYVRGLSAGMNDLLKEPFREHLRRWFRDVARRAQGGAPVSRRFAPLVSQPIEYRPTLASSPDGTDRAGAPAAGGGGAVAGGGGAVAGGGGAVAGGGGAVAGGGADRRVVLLSDAEPGDRNLLAMEDRLAGRLGATVDRISLADMGLRGGCLGCLRCGWDGRCIYRDGFQETFRERVLSADAIVFSGAVRGRFFSARLKQLWDRTFFLGHRPELQGKPVLWLVSGPLRQLHTLREVIEGYSGVARALLVDIVTDEVADADALDALLLEAAERLVRFLETPIRTPRLFPAVAGSRIFRDFVYLARGVFAEDHRFYQKAGYYDFPQHKVRQRAADLALYLGMHVSPVRKKAQKEMTRLMLRPFEKIVGPLGGVKGGS